MSDYPDTFKISEDGRSITCLHCHRTSYHLKDVEHLYCGHCHVFHDDIFPPARASWITSPPPASAPGETSDIAP